MLRIQKEQMAELSRVALEDFVERVRDHLREEYWARTAAMPDEAIDALTRRALARAPIYSLENEYEIARFTELLLTLGPAFDESPGVSDLLLDTETDADSRFEAVTAMINETQALEVAS